MESPVPQNRQWQLHSKPLHCKDLPWVSFVFSLSFLLCVQSSFQFHVGCHVSYLQIYRHIYRYSLHPIQSQCLIAVWEFCDKCISGCFCKCSYNVHDIKPFAKRKKTEPSMRKMWNGHRIDFFSLSALISAPRWLFEGVVRQKAEELLRLPGNVVGSFMVRESPKQRGKIRAFYST